ncbi:MAG: hypothetical protein JJU29_23575 [Verrucomicrobia bacterium]|nr:hypothetical protein [Verrucomicrobiota bacterium]MCH8510343.1 AAA family ATPase [Kiritimatiellia bacterium]
MKLLSIQLSNFRAHLDTKLAFDERITLVEAANEWGKSTLLEALTHAFTSSEKLGKGVVDTFRSAAGATGSPRIQVEFQLGEQTWELTKQFNGGSGVIELKSDRETLTGQAAADRLRTLLGVEQEGGRGWSNRVSSIWAHVWVRQNTAFQGLDTVDNLTGKLTERLQNLGGAGLVASDLDQAVIRKVEEEYGKYYTATGREASASPLSEARGRHQAAMEDAQRAEQTLSALQADLREFKETKERLTHCKREAAELMERVRGKEEEVESLRIAPTEGRRLEEELEKAKLLKESLRQQQANLEAKRKEMAQLQSEKEKLEASLAGRREMQEKRRAEFQGISAENPEQELKSVRGVAKYFQEVLNALKAEEELKQVNIRLKRVAEHEAELRAQQEALAKLPEMDLTRLNALRKAHKQAHEARLQLDSMAADLCVDGADLPVRIQEKDLQAGETHRFTEEVVLRVGKGVRLRIRPGGGEKAMEQRARTQELEAQLAQMLAKADFQTLADAEAVYERRGKLLGDIATTEKLLQSLEPEKLRTQETKLRPAMEAARQRAESCRAELAEPPPVPQNLLEAEKALQAADETEKALDKKITGIRAKRDQLEQDLQRADQELRVQESALQESAQQLARLEATVSTMEGDAGSGDLKTRLAEVDRAAEALEQKLSAFEQKQKVFLDTEGDLKALKQSRERTQDKVHDLEKKQSATLAHLNSFTHQDPESACSLARDRLALSAKQLQELELHAKAVQHLKRLLDQQKAALQEELTQPFMEKVRPYLRELFGADADVHMASLENLASPTLQRDLPFSFDALSTGAREQLNAVLRLGIAELFQADAEGGLPVIFDDAFVNSDPVRCEKICRTLRLAADHGLQIIVMTCQPAHYQLLGAPPLQLERRPLRTSFAASRPPERPALSEGADEIRGDAVSAGPSPAPFVAPSAGMTAQEEALLHALAGKAEGKSGNISLRNELGWEEDRYNAAVQSLEDRGILERGRGRGGSVQLTPAGKAGQS